MKNIFDSEGKLMTFLDGFADVMVLAILWVICSMPIITVGASTTAFYSVMMKLVVGEESYVVRSFFKAFKENFKISTIVWLIMGTIGGLVCTSLYIVFNSSKVGSKLFYALPFYLLVLIIYTMTINFVFPYIAKFYDTVKRTLMISLIFSTRHFLQSILLIIIDVAIFIFAFKIPALFILFPLISGFCHAKVYQKIFAKIIDARDEENSESNMVQELD